MTLTEAETAESFYLGGASRNSTGDAIPVINPADERVLASVPSATADEVHQALLAAKSAQRGWARTPSVVRGGFLRATADLVSRHRDKLAELIVAEVGKPARQAAGIGGEDGKWGLLRYTQVKTAYHHYG